MKQNTNPPGTDDRKFHKQIDDLNKLLLEKGGHDFRYLDDLPDLSGKDEPIPCPFGTGKGHDFGQWVDQKQQKNRSDE